MHHQWRILDLGDGRTLVQQGGHVRIWREPGFADLCRVFDAISTCKDLEAARQRLVRDYEDKDVAALLAAIGPIPSPPALPEPVALLPWVEKPGWRLGVAGEGPVAERLAHHFNAPKWRLAPSPERKSPRAWPGPVPADKNAGLSAADLTAGLADIDLLVVSVEGGCFADLYQYTSLTAVAGVQTLVVQADGHDLVLGPLFQPGQTPCINCLHAVEYARLRWGESQRREALAPMRLGHAASPGKVVAAVSAELQRLAVSPWPDLQRGAKLLRLRQGFRPVSRQANCSICGACKPSCEEKPDDPARRTGQVTGGHDADNPRIDTVAILGGGTAGYLTALALRRYRPDLDVTLIESRDVPVIGVGEATTPLMPQFLHADLGLDIHAFFREVQPTLKLGIRFDWGASGHFDYPFGPIDPVSAHAHDGNLSAISLNAWLMDRHALPVYQREDGGWSWELDHNTAYHLDNRRFVAYLQRQAETAGIRCLDAKVDRVERRGDGVAALHTVDGRRLAFDFFIDCSGFRSLLLEGALGSPFIDYASTLPNDRALIASVPHGETVAPFTSARTMRAGWCWQTPQLDSDHRGYVYCSDFLDDDAAEVEMRRANPRMGDARLIRFRTGRHREAWLGNVVALGNAYGFVEPLESTALHLLIRQIVWLLLDFPERICEPGKAARHNIRTGEAWDYLRWFLGIHFRFNHRYDTAYWQHLREQTDDSVYESLIHIYRKQGPMTAVFGSQDWYLPDPLWGPEGIDTILLGQGVQPSGNARRHRKAGWRTQLRDWEEKSNRALSHRTALMETTAHADWLDRFQAAFRQIGSVYRPG